MDNRIESSLIARFTALKILPTGLQSKLVLFPSIKMVSSLVLILPVMPSVSGLGFPNIACKLIYGVLG